MTLDGILKEYFGCEKPFLDRRREIGEDYYEYFTESGAEAYKRLIGLIYDLGALEVLENSEDIVESLDAIVTEDYCDGDDDEFDDDDDGDDINKDEGNSASSEIDEEYISRRMAVVYKSGLPGFYRDGRGAYGVVVDGYYISCYVNTEDGLYDVTVDTVGDDGLFNTNVDWECYCKVDEAIDRLREFTKKYAKKENVK